MRPSAHSPRLGTPAEFAALRGYLAASGYTETAVCQRLGISRLSQAAALWAEGAPSDALDALIRLFLLEEPTVAAALPAEFVATAAALGLLEARSDALAPCVKLYPVQSVWVVSDLDRGRKAGGDHVFSAISPQTEDFLRMTGAGRCPACLELCAGAAAGALLAAQRFAVQAYAFDISARCAAFAEFNRRLNGLSNLTVRQGDLYAPARGQTFDRILAHPPYVPSLRTTQVFRDGGGDGETLTRRIVEGLPEYLHPGGRLYLTAMLAEYAGDSIEARLRRWLRHAAPEFDLLLVLRNRYDAGGFLFDNADPADVPAWRQLLEQRRITSFRYLTAIVERHRKEAPAITLSRTAADGFCIADAERALATAQRVNAGDWLELRPIIESAAVSACVHNTLRDGAWRPESLHLRRGGPFAVEIPAPQSAAVLLARCDGRATIRELGSESVLRQWILGGILEIA